MCLELNTRFPSAVKTKIRGWQNVIGFATKPAKNLLWIAIVSTSATKLVRKTYKFRLERTSGMRLFTHPDLINVGFSNYQMCHETFALTRLCMFILTGKATVQTLNDGVIKRFWEKGTSPNRAERFKSVAEILSAVQKITDEDIEII